MVGLRGEVQHNDQHNGVMLPDTGVVVLSAHAWGTAVSPCLLLGTCYRLRHLGYYFLPICAGDK